MCCIFTIILLQYFNKNIQKHLLRLIMSKYYQPSMPRRLEYQITKLFGDQPEVADLYDQNKVRFIEDAVRRLILEYRSNVENSEK